MGTVHLPHCTDVDWLTVGPIAPHAGVIKQHFADGRYALSTVASYLSNIEANLAMKEKALARLEPPDTKMGRFRAPDALMRFLRVGRDS